MTRYRFVVEVDLGQLETGTDPKQYVVDCLEVGDELGAIAVKQIEEEVLP